MSAITALQSSVTAIETRIASTPMPEREKYTCECGSTGCVAVHVQCTACGKNATRGFEPPRE